MKRILVSDAIASMMVRPDYLLFIHVNAMMKEYVTSNEKEDYLLQGSMIKNRKDGLRTENNPFRVKASHYNCTIS